MRRFSGNPIPIGANLAEPAPRGKGEVTYPPCSVALRSELEARATRISRARSQNPALVGALVLGTPGRRPATRWKDWGKCRLDPRWVGIDSERLLPSSAGGGARGQFQGIVYATVGEGADLRTGWSELYNGLECLAGAIVLRKRLMEAS